jgi:hypothetical protein
MKGLSFSEPMMKAWLSGQKSITRRLMNPQPTENVGIVDDTWIEWWKVDRGDGESDTDCRILKPRYLPGETVYIKETWFQVQNKDFTPGMVIYKSDGWKPSEKGCPVGWKSPRFMPSWAARSHALIVSVRPERVQEITREDAHNEGFWPGQNGLESWNGKPYGNAQLAFQACWESLYPGSWGRNDFVWRIELEKRP